MDAKKERERMGEIKAEMLEIKTNMEAQERAAMNEDEQTKWDALEEEYRACEQRAETAERFERLPEEKPSQIVTPQKSYTGKKVVTRSDVGKATKAWLTRNSSLQAPEFRDCADRLGFSWNQPSINVNLLGNGESIQERQQSVGTDSEGGYAVSNEIVMGFEEALANFWSWSNIVSTHRTRTNGPYRLVLADDTGNEATYTSELASITNTSLVFDEHVFNDYKLTSGVFPVSNETLEDNEIGIGSYIGRALGTRIARKLAREITNGAGGGTALTGFAGATTEGVAAASTTAIDQDELIDLYFALEDAYRSSAVWMMHSLVLAEIVKLEDADGRKLFGQGLNGSPQMTLLGKPIVVNDFLPSTLAATNKVVYFGDFSHVHVRMVRDVNIAESSEQHWLEDARAYKATLRADSAYVNAGTDPILHLAMAAV